MSLLRPAHRETLPSFLSRLAASKGVRTPDFAYDLGTPFKRFLRFDAKDVSKLGNWAEISDQEMDELQSWTGIPVGNIRLQFRGEQVVSRALRNPIMEGCPACLREEAKKNPAQPLSMMTMRGDWQLREVTVCLRHRRLLVPLWTEDQQTQRFDIQGQLLQILDRIMAGDMDGAKVEPSPFDIWLDDRLSGQPDPTWLAPHCTGASAMFCRMFGKGMLPGTQAEDPIPQRHNAAAAGFTLVREGPEAIKSNLVDLAARGETGSDPVRQAHRRMFEALDTHLLDDPSFDVFRTVLRDAVLNIWPIAAGETVLGAVLDERVLHSVTSAAVETGIPIDRLRRMLVEAGALAANDPRPNARATFDAMAFAPLLADIS